MKVLDYAQSHVPMQKNPAIQFFPNKPGKLFDSLASETRACHFGETSSNAYTVSYASGFESKGKEMKYEPIPSMSGSPPAKRCVRKKKKFFTNSTCRNVDVKGGTNLSRACPVCGQEVPRIRRLFPSLLSHRSYFKSQRMPLDRYNHDYLSRWRFSTIFRAAARY